MYYVADNLVLVNSGAGSTHQRREGGNPLIRDTNPRHLRRDASDALCVGRARRRDPVLGFVGRPPFPPERLAVAEQLVLLGDANDHEYLPAPEPLPYRVLHIDWAVEWEEERRLEDLLELEEEFERRLAQELRQLELCRSYPTDDGMLLRCMTEGDLSPDDEPMEQIFLPLELRVGDFDYAMIPVNAAA